MEFCCTLDCGYPIYVGSMMFIECKISLACTTDQKFICFAFFLHGFYHLIPFIVTPFLQPQPPFPFTHSLTHSTISLNHTTPYIPTPTPSLNASRCAPHHQHKGHAPTLTPKPTHTRLASVTMMMLLLRHVAAGMVCAFCAWKSREGGVG